MAAKRTARRGRLLRAALAATALAGLVAAGIGIGVASASASDAPGTSPCTADALRARVLGTDSGAGTTAVTIAISNGSTASCGLPGYPSVRLLDGHGQAVPGAVRPLDAGPGTSVALAAGGVGSFAVLYRDFDPASGAPCAPVSALLITVPGGTGALTVPAAFAPCGEVSVSTVSPGERRW